MMSKQEYNMYVHIYVWFMMNKFIYLCLKYIQDNFILMTSLIAKLGI